MGLIPTLVAFTAGTLIKAADFNTNYDAIVNAFNNTAVLTDVAKTISVAHTFAADILFADALYDIGKSGATRPRDGFFSRNLTVGQSIEAPAYRGSPAAAMGVGPRTNQALQFFTNDLLRAQLTSGGILLIGTTVATSMGAGEVALGNARPLRAVNAAGTDTFDLIRATAGDAVAVGFSGAQVIVLGSPGSVSGAAAADVVIQNGKYLRSTNSAGTGTRTLIGGSTDAGSREAVSVGATADVPIAIGVPATYLNAGGGELLLANNKFLRATDLAAGTTYGLIKLNATNATQIGDGGTAIAVGTTIPGASHAANDVVLANSKWLRGANTAASNTIAIISVQGADQVQIAPASVLSIGNPGSQLNATAGEAVFANAKSIRWSNSAGNNTVDAIKVDANGVVILAPASPMVIGAPASTTGVAAGDVVFAKDTSIRRSNNAGSASKRVITFGGADDNIYFDADAVAAFGFGTTVMTSAVAGDMVIRNAKALRGVTALGTDTISLVKLDANNVLQLADPGGNGVCASLGGRTNAALDAGAAAKNGIVTTDTTNNRLVYYSGGNRYFIAGTAF